MTNAHTFSARALWLLAALSLTWGVNWPMMKIALGEIGVWHFRTLCLLGGASAVFALVAQRGLRWRVPTGQWGRLALIAALNMGAWNILAGYGIPLVASGRAAILAYSMPLWSVLLGTWILGEMLTGRRVAALLLGLAGMSLLLVDEFRAIERSPLGALLLIGAALSWAGGIIVMKARPVDLPATAMTAWQMLIAGIPIGCIALLFEDSTFRLWSLSPAAAWAGVYTITVAFMFAQWAWIKIALLAPVAVSSISTLAIPIVGVFSAALILGEVPKWTDYVALALVVSAVATVLFESGPRVMASAAVTRRQ